MANSTPEGEGGKGKRANYWEGQGAIDAARPGGALSRIQTPTEETSLMPKAGTHFSSLPFSLFLICHGRAQE